ncbi:DUF881 domain-containing protein [Ornithinicoccus hortensis]
MPVVTLAAGLMFGTSAALADRTGSVERPTDLAGLIQERNRAVADLTRQAEELSAEVDGLSRDGSTVRQTTAQADRIAPGVGTLPVQGPALRVTLDDAGYSLETLPEGYTVDDVVVHQQDVQSVVNALWSGGAEAMMIQDQRIVATSSVQCVGNTLYLQGRVYSPPYSITAIGDVEGMQQALEDDPVVTNFRGWSRALGLGYQVEDVGVQEFPGYAGPTRPLHAEVITPREPTEPTVGPVQR